MPAAGMVHEATSIRWEPVPSPAGTSGAAAGVRLVVPSGRSRVQVLELAPVDDSGRVRVGLVLAPRRRAIDVSRQPGLVDRAVDEALPHVGGGRGTRARVTGELAEHARRWGCWAPHGEPGADDLLSVVGGAAFPMLGQAYERGALARREVPAWAAEVMAASDARAAALVAFGPSRVTRRVTAALAGTLARPGVVVGLHPLGLALVAVDVLDPDRLATLLDQGAAGAPTTGPGVPGGHASDEGAEPREAATAPVGRDGRGDALQPFDLSVDDLRRGRSAASAWGPDVTAAVLAEALRRPDGVTVLTDVLAAWASVGAQVTGRLPRRLDDLAALLRRHQPIDPLPDTLAADDDPSSDGRRSAGAGRQRGRPAPQRRVAATDAGPRGREPVELVADVFGAATVLGPTAPRGPRRARPDERAPQRRTSEVADDASMAVPTQALVAPRVRPRPAPTGTAPERFGLPAAVGRLHGDVVGDLRLVVPRTASELVEWGRRLGNCLDTYVAAVATGTSRLIGVEAHGRLTYCVEITRSGQLRQFLGARNVAPDPHHADAVVRHLRRAGVLRPG